MTAGCDAAPAPDDRPTMPTAECFSLSEGRLKAAPSPPEDHRIRHDKALAAKGHDAAVALAHSAEHRCRCAGSRIHGHRRSVPELQHAGRAVGQAPLCRPGAATLAEDAESAQGFCCTGRGVQGTLPVAWKGVPGTRASALPGVAASARNAAAAQPSRPWSGVATRHPFRPSALRQSRLRRIRPCARRARSGATVGLTAGRAGAGSRCRTLPQPRPRDRPPDRHRPCPAPARRRCR